METTNNWLVLRLKSNRERNVSQFLENKGINCYLPVRKIPSTSTVPRPDISSRLFPGYLFVNLPSNNASELRYVPGTCGLINFNGRPAVIRSEEIEQIRILATTESDLQRHDNIYQGERVLIIKGPLSGIEGEFVRLKNSNRLVVNILMLNQSLSVEISKNWLTCPQTAGASFDDRRKSMASIANLQTRH